MMNTCMMMGENGMRCDDMINMNMMDYNNVL